MTCVILPAPLPLNSRTTVWGIDCIAGCAPDAQAASTNVNATVADRFMRPRFRRLACTAFSSRFRLFPWPIWDSRDTAFPPTVGVPKDHGDNAVRGKTDQKTDRIVPPDSRINAQIFYDRAALFAC